MVQMNFNPFMLTEVKQKQEELYKEMEKIRLMEMFRESEAPKVQVPSKVLARVGKVLANIGTNLEQRYGMQSEPKSSLSHQSSPEGCA